MKKYGIYIAYPPAVDLRAQGLGRHLGEFLKGAVERDDVRFVVACPSWTRTAFYQLLESIGLPEDTFEVIGPKRKPLSLTLYEHYSQFDHRRKASRHRFRLVFDRLRKHASHFGAAGIRLLVGTRNPLLLVLVGAAVVFITLVGALISGLAAVGHAGLRAVRSALGRGLPGLSRLRQALRRIGASPKSHAIVSRLYGLMAEEESRLIVGQINLRTDIRAWYAPAAFWPEFNKIDGPRVMCVPDVVLSTFPVAFSNVGGQRFLDNFRRIHQSISEGERFITYSNHIKQSTLIERFRIAPSRIAVVPHGANKLARLITVRGAVDAEDATKKFCADLVKGAFAKAIGSSTADLMDTDDLQFIFFASQFRPNKNIVSLIRAYEYLVKRRYLPHKLVLTGNPNEVPEIGELIRAKNLQNDVLCLHGLTDREVAACYKKADLAVSSSLSEGGCPFTLTEALSVDTPAVMARIPVTEEVLVEPDLRDMMLFDPYDWHDIAKRIEWALENKHILLGRQRQLYGRLEQRSWRDVVDEHIVVFESAAAQIGRVAPI